MGFFDGLGSRLADTASNAVSGATATVFDYFQATASEALVKVGVAPSGNLTPEEIAAGKTGSPPQPTVVPSKVPASDLQGAVPAAIFGGSLPIGLLVGVAVVAYLIAKRR